MSNFPSSIPTETLLPIVEEIDSAREAYFHGDLDLESHDAGLQLIERWRAVERAEAKLGEAVVQLIRSTELENSNE